ncbi:PTS mannitol transporter subunit IICBA [Hutsoniella sourekii]
MSQTKNNAGIKAAVQKLGSHLSSMVMPNIGAFIAWGIITALFIPAGYLPNEQLNTIVGPMQQYLLPLLIAYTGGNMVHGQRGAVVGAIGTMGVIMGAGDIPMFIGAMMMGPFGGWCIKKFDENFQDKIPSGFEMLVNNFSSGIVGFILAILGFYAIGPVVSAATSLLARGVAVVVQAGLLPLANIFIEPAKILFLNNAINHGILTPLGTQEVTEMGRSILYLLEANPGPGLGVLLAYMLFGKGSAKSSAPGAAIIHFLGGIHEIYFPYVMMKPLMFLAVIAGGVTGTFIFQMFGAALTSPASPGSIIAILGMGAQGAHLPIILGVAGAALVSFVVAAVILKSDKSTDDNFEAQKQATAHAKAQSKGQAGAEGDVEAKSDELPTFDEIDAIVFACDAGMGSSAMGASLLRKKAKSIGLNIPITNSAINNLTDSATTLVITQEELTNRARKQVPKSIHVSVENFLDGDRYDQILGDMQAKSEGDGPETSAVTRSEPVESNAGLEIQGVDRIIFAYVDKVGASTMAASQFRNQLSKAGKSIAVTAQALSEIEDQANTLVISQADQERLVEDHLPNARHISFEDLLDEANYRSLIDSL